MIKMTADTRDGRISGDCTFSGGMLDVVTELSAALKHTARQIISAADDNDDREAAIFTLIGMISSVSDMLEQIATGSDGGDPDARL